MLIFENISARQLIFANLDMAEAAFDGGGGRLGGEKEKGNQGTFSATFSAHNGNWSPISILSKRGGSDIESPQGDVHSDEIKSSCTTHEEPLVHAASQVPNGAATHMQQGALVFCDKGPHQPSLPPQLPYSVGLVAAEQIGTGETDRHEIPPSGRNANIGRSGVQRVRTIGLSVYGTQIDFVVPETICAPAFSRGNNSAQGIIGDREEEIAQDEDDDDEEDDVSFTSGVSFIAPHELSQVPERERKREREREREKEREKAKERARKRERVSGTKKIETRERGREEREREGVCTRGMPRVAHAYKECIAVYPLVTFCFALHFMCGTINRVLLSSSPVRGSLHGAILVHLVRKVWMSEYAYEYGVQIW